MKEATGGLNAGLVVVIAIGIMATFFYQILWPQVKSNYDRNTQCDKAVCRSSTYNHNTGMVLCDLYDDKGNIVETNMECVYKG